jgi:hypothetical protein
MLYRLKVKKGVCCLNSPYRFNNYACENDRDRNWALDLCVGVGVGQTRGFFNHNMKFASTGSRTPDLRSATQTT